MTASLREVVFAHDELAELDPAERRLALREIVHEAGIEDAGEAVERLAEDIDGFGPLSKLMSDSAITDILVNGPAETWFEKDGRLTPAEGCFEDRDELLRWCERTVSRAGGRIDMSRPIADVRLPDGSRLHAVLPPIAPGGPLVSIRKMPAHVRSLSELVELGLMSEAQSAELRAHIESKRSICVSGATGVGKTTLLNAILMLVPSSERVVVMRSCPSWFVQRELCL
jgi:pilus assembly protein CpaF